MRKKKRETPKHRLKKLKEEITTKWQIKTNKILKTSGGKDILYTADFSSELNPEDKGVGSQTSGFSII